jgi:PhnB protein
MSPEIQPELWVSDAPAAVAFYERALGAQVQHRVDGPGERDLIAQLVADDPDAIVAAAEAAGATVTSAVQEEHGWRLGRFTDPFGHDWEVGHPLGD